MPLSRRSSFVLALCIVAIRVGLALPGSRPLNDPDNYLPIARSLAEGRGFQIERGVPTAYRPPLYPLLLAPIVGLCGEATLPWAVAALHLGLGLGAAALTFAAARLWGLPEARSAVAALIVAADPVTVFQSRAVMTETLAAFLVAACLAALALPGRRGLVLGGLSAGLGALCRPSLLPGSALVVLAILATAPGSFRRRLAGASVFAAALAATMAPWAIRNRIELGSTVWTTTHGGFTLALANNPMYYADILDGPPGRVWGGPSQDAFKEWARDEAVGLSEVEADRRLRDATIRFIASRPADFARASLARLGRFWGLAPSGSVYPPSARLLTAIWTAPLLLAAALGACRSGTYRWPRIVAPALIIGLTSVHAAYWTDMRMRVPLIAAAALLAAGAGRGSENGAGPADFR